MPVRKIRYYQYAIVMFVLALLAAAFLPMLLKMSPVVTTHISHLMMTLFGLGAVMIVYLDDRMVKQALYQNKQMKIVTLWLPILGQTIWYLVVLWIYLINLHDHTMQTMTLPMLFLGMALMMTSLGLLQKETLSVIVNEPMKKTARRLNIATVFLAVYALLFFGLTASWVYGLTIMISVLVIADANWPALWAGWHREKSLEGLPTQGINFRDVRVIEKLHKVSTIVTEKRGILTDDHITIHSILSLDDRYSDFDILGLATGILALEPTSGLSQAIVQYAEDHTIFPSTASEPEIVPGAGVRGVVFNERFAVLSAAETLAEDYVIDEDALTTYKNLGNSVSYVVDDLQVIGVITFGDTLSKSLISLNDFFVKRHLSAKLASGDTFGATAPLAKLMPSLTEVYSDLTPVEKQEQVDKWLAQENTMFVTNQDNLPENSSAITVAVNRPDLNADIHVKEIADLKKFWATADRLVQINKKMLRWSSLPVIILLFLAAGLGIFISPWLYISPIIAVIIRCIMSYILKVQIRNKKNKVNS